MFFSVKVLYPVFALFSVAAVGFASPIAVAEPNALVKRTDAVTSAVQSFSDQVTPLITALTPATATADAQINAIVNLFVNAKVDILGLVDVNADVDVVAIVDLNVALFIKLFGAVNSFSLLDLTIFAQVDAAVSAYLNAFASINAEIAVSIGKGIPIADISLFVSLKLVLTLTVLGLVNLLGGLGL